MEGAGERLRGLRTKYGLTQNDLACEGLDQTYISMLEQGKADFNMRVASKITKMFNLVAKKKQIKLEQEITPELLIGRKENDIDRLVNNLKQGAEYAIREIEWFLEDCTCELGEELINRMYEDVFKYDFRKYRDDICTYFDKIFKYVKDTKKMTEIRVKLIRAKLFSDNPNKYVDIINIYNVVGNDINQCQDEIKSAYYNNVASAYYNLKEYGEADDVIVKAKKISNNPHILKTLSIEANICIKQLRYRRAINIYKEIISLSKDVNDLANAYSNLADIYNTINKLELSNKYIDKAFEFIDDLTVHYKYNLYYVRLQIEIKEKINIEKTLINALICSKNLNSKEKVERVKKVLDLYFDYNNKNNFKINNIVDVLSKTKTEIDSKSFIDNILYHIVDEETRAIIESITYY